MQCYPKFFDITQSSSTFSGTSEQRRHNLDYVMFRKSVMQCRMRFNSEEVIWGMKKHIRFIIRVQLHMNEMAMFEVNV